MILQPIYDSTDIGKVSILKYEVLVGICLCKPVKDYYLVTVIGLLTSQSSDYLPWFLIEIWNLPLSRSQNEAVHSTSSPAAMATTTVFALVTLSKALSWNEALSGVFGSISLATWIFLLVGSSHLLEFEERF